MGEKYYGPIGGLIVSLKNLSRQIKKKVLY